MMENLFTDDIYFLLDSIAIDIKEFTEYRSDSLEWVKGKTIKINKDSKRIFDFFFDKNDIPLDHYPQYHTSPYWGEATNNYKLRFVIIKDTYNYFLVIVRIMGIMYHEQYFALNMDIMCDNPKIDANAKIIPLLRNIDCIKKIECIVSESDDWDNCNFFCTPENIVNANKRRRKQYRRAVQLYQNGVRMERISIPNANFTIKCKELFADFERMRFKFNQKNTLKMIDIVVNDGKRTVFCWWLKDKLLAIQVVCNDFLNASSIHAGKDISTFPLDYIAEHYTDGDMELAKDIKGYLGILQEEEVKKVVFNELGYDALYIDGAHGDKGKYLEHKKKHYDKCIFYKLKDLSKYGTN